MEKRYYDISLEDAATAKRNGISKNLLHQRVYNHKWDVDRAITQLTRPQISFRSEWIETARVNGIDLPQFRRRVRFGWGEEVAATTPILTKKEAVERATAKFVENRKKAKTL